MIRRFFTHCIIILTSLVSLEKVHAEHPSFVFNPSFGASTPGFPSFTRFLGVLPKICKVEEEYSSPKPYFVAKFEMETPQLKQAEISTETPKLKAASTDWCCVPCEEKPYTFKENLYYILEESQGEKDFWEHYDEEGWAFCQDVVSDYRNYYSIQNGVRFLIALGIAAPLANTKADMEIHNWYQKQVRCSETDSLATFWKNFGEGEYVLPIACGLTLIALGTDESLGWLDQIVGEYGKNLTRSYLVGSIPMVVMQCILGGDRPCNGSTYWHPFVQNHSVSGHAYIGASPFIMAAKMTDPIWLKAILYTCSILPGWSRINDGAHSLSQVGLGWFMAYMACDVVVETNQNRDSNYMVTPIVSGDQVGVNLMMKF